jgi:coenzyme F420-dependent glucose-6-phosphate dehydrogenase
VTRFAYFCGHEQWQPEDLVRHAALAEQAGFDMVVVSEHFHPWVDDVGAAGFAFATMGAIAHATQHIEIATGVTTPLFRYHPALVAQAAATIDRLSAGRFRLGVGTGENLNEGPLRYAFPCYAERAERITEAIEIIRALLDGEKLTYNGQHYRTDRAKLYSPPIGRVPIWLAAGGPKSAAMAATLTDGIITSVKSPEDTKLRVLEPAFAAAKAAGRSRPQILAMRWSIFARNADAAWKALAAWRGLRAPGRLEAVDPMVLRQRADEMPRGEVIDQYSLVSSADDYVETYLPLVTEVKANVVTIQTTSVDQEATIALLGRDVLPRLRDAADS